MKSSTQSVAVMWAAAKRRRQQIPAINSLVLAKMKKYSPWPSKLLSIEGKRAYVYFFGSNNHGHVDKDEIADFHDNELMVLKLATMKITDYKKAVREAEIFGNIPWCLSVLNRL